MTAPETMIPATTSDTWTAEMAKLRSRYKLQDRAGADPRCAQPAAAPRPEYDRRRREGVVRNTRHPDHCRFDQRRSQPPGKGRRRTRRHHDSRGGHHGLGDHLAPPRPARVLEGPTTLPEGTVHDLVVDELGADLCAAERTLRADALVNARQEAQAGQGQTAEDVVRDVRRCCSMPSSPMRNYRSVAIEAGWRESRLVVHPTAALASMPVRAAAPLPDSPIRPLDRKGAPVIRPRKCLGGWTGRLRWLHREQAQVIDYPVEENRVLREQLGDKRTRLTDDQRRRLTAKGKVLGRSLVAKVASIDLRMSVAPRAR